MRMRLDKVPCSNCVQSAANLSSAEQLIEELVEQAERLEGGGAKEGGSGAIENGEAGMAQFLLRQTIETIAVVLLVTVQVPVYPPQDLLGALMWTVPLLTLPRREKWNKKKWLRRYVCDSV